MHVRSVFTTRSIVEALPESVLKAAQEQRRHGELMALLVYYVQDAYRKGLDAPLTTDRLEVLLFSH